MAEILIIEDSPSQALIIQEIVQSAGHQVTLFKEFSKGITHIFKAKHFDLVLLDLVLLGNDGKPVADGFQLCREIKRVTEKKTKVVVVSSKGDKESTDWAVIQGADAFLQKPFNVTQLVSIVDELLVS